MHADLLSSGARADIHMVECKGNRAVRKTFRVGYERHFDREVQARITMAEKFPEIPPLLEVHQRSFVTPYYEDILKFSRGESRLVPIWCVIRVLDFLERLYDEGFALIDAHPENFLVNREGGLIFYDLEFLQPYEDSKPDDFLNSWDLVGPPADWLGDEPAGGATTWATHWQPYVGLSAEQCMSLPGWKMRYYRMLHWTSSSLPRAIDRHLPPWGIQAKHKVGKLMRTLFRKR